jgi:hypothetical protein
VTYRVINFVESFTARRDFNLAAGLLKKDSKIIAALSEIARIANVVISNWRCEAVLPLGESAEANR